MSIRRTIFILGAFIAILLLANCSLSSAYPDRALYAIRTGKPEASAERPPAINRTLRVRRIVATVPYGGTAFVHRTSLHGLSLDYYNAYAAPPADLVTGELVQWLRTDRVFSTVTDGSSGLQHQWVLEGCIRELVVDESNRAAPEALFSLQMLLLDETTGTPVCLMDKTYAERIPIKSADPAAVIDGLSTACRAVFMKATADMRALR